MRIVPPDIARGCGTLCKGAGVDFRRTGADRVGAGQGLLLLSKSAFAAGPHREMAVLAVALARLPAVGAQFDAVESCFLEQGEPSLRMAILDLAARGITRITLLPVILPMEPGMRSWLSRNLSRWSAEAGADAPEIEIAGEIAGAPGLVDLLAALVQQGTQDLVPSVPVPAEGVQVPPQHYRVLVCSGPACHAAGATAIWSHLRNLQTGRKLRTCGGGTMTARTTCLGPCALAPVVQVFPDGTWYGGVTEPALVRIVDEHLLAGRPVADFAYAPGGRKQQLREQTPPVSTKDLQ